MCQQGVTASHGFMKGGLVSFMRKTLVALEAQQECEPCKWG